jgi:hypothetical protein
MTAISISRPWRRCRHGTVSLALALSVACGCGLFEADGEPGESLIVATPYDTEELLRDGEIGPLPDIRLNFFILERLRHDGGDGARLDLFVRSEQERGSSSVRFLADARSNGNRISVDFAGVYHPRFQSGDIWYTRWHTELLIDEGVYSLELSYRGQRSIYTIRAGGTGLEISPGTSIGRFTPLSTESARLAPS